MTPASGTGLGLAICREVCDRNGAQLRLHNRLHANGRVQGLDATVFTARVVAPGAGEPHNHAP